MNVLVDFLRLMRPRQWIKSGFVFVGILFANAWKLPGMFVRVSLAAIAFSLVASGVYALNDLFDCDQDRSHPKKTNRPVAAARISPTSAAVLAIVLWLIGVALGWYVSTNVALILLLYIMVNLTYSIGLKHVVLLDVFLIASGFMLRILAGTSGVGIAPSQWLMLCGLMVALFLGFAKRRAELYAKSGENQTHRRVLENYQPVLLDKMIVITATCVILTYSLYTMSPITIQAHRTDKLIYTLPFVMYGIFRYIYSLHMQQTGSEPAAEIFRDRHILFAILGWLLTTVLLISTH